MARTEHGSPIRRSGLVLENAGRTERDDRMTACQAYGATRNGASGSPVTITRWGA
jgi:hypothetical protein